MCIRDSQQEEELPEHVKDYINILAAKSERLKTMVQDIFDVSKATSGNIELNPEELDYGKLIRQTLADMAEKIEESGLAFREAIPEEPVFILADGHRMYRVFQNLIDITDSCRRVLPHSFQSQHFRICFRENTIHAFGGSMKTSSTLSSS